MVKNFAANSNQNQVQQELSSTFARLCHLVDESTAEMKEEAKSLEREVRQLEEIAGRSKVITYLFCLVHSISLQLNFDTRCWEIRPLTFFRFQVLRNQATFLGNKLEMFSTTYLGLEWKTFRAWNLFKILQLVAICGPPALYIYIMPSYWTTLCYWAYQSSVICSPYVAIDQIFRRMNLSALVLHLSWAVPDIFASCVSNGIHSVSIKYTSLFNTEYFLLLPVSRASEYGISLFEIYERPLHRVWGGEW